MTGSLRPAGRVPLPPGRAGSFDHADVDPVTGRVFVAHTEFATVDVIDPDSLRALEPIDGCPEGSGLFCAPAERLVFAASRGLGKVVLIDADGLRQVGEVAVGPKPNGLAWDGRRRRLLVADVDGADQAARIVDAASRSVIASTRLPGRPRWCVYDPAGDRFLVNIREPASLLVLSPDGEVSATWTVPSAGPHGLDIDTERGEAFVACDGGEVVVIGLADGRVMGRIPISGQPDATWFNRARRRLYVGVADPGVIDVVDTEKRALAETVATEPGAKTSAFDAERQRLYVFLPGSCAAAVCEEASAAG